MIKDGPATRKKLLIEAEKLFAAKGFYGASLGAIASKVGISKPSLLHHFPSKEKLYGAVLAEIAANMLGALHRDLADTSDEREQLHRFADDLSAWSDHHRLHAQILMRELLDNPARLKKIKTWYLAPLIDQLVTIVESGQRKGRFRKLDALSFVLSLLASQHYYAISRPTFEQMMDERRYRSLASGRGKELKRLIDDALVG